MIKYILPLLLLSPLPAYGDTISQVIRDRNALPKHDKRIKYCQGERFKPCVCASQVTYAMQYRPSLKECSNKAAIILSGKYLNIFSVVVRDKDNRDRWPTSGYGDCSAYERDVLGLNKCSAFKMQKKIKVRNRRGNAVVYCLGAPGESKLFARVSRVTIKLKDIPNSSNDPIDRLCLFGPKEKLN